MDSILASATERELVATTPFAIVLEGITTRWQANVIQLPGALTRTKVALDGYGEIDATALVLSKDQARRLAAEINELLQSGA